MKQTVDTKLNKLEKMVSFDDEQKSLHEWIVSGHKLSELHNLLDNTSLSDPAALELDECRPKIDPKQEVYMIDYDGCDDDIVCSYFDEIEEYRLLLLGTIQLLEVDLTIEREEQHIVDWGDGETMPEEADDE